MDTTSSDQPLRNTNVSSIVHLDGKVLTIDGITYNTNQINSVLIKKVKPKKQNWQFYVFVIFGFVCLPLLAFPPVWILFTIISYLIWGRKSKDLEWGLFFDMSNKNVSVFSSPKEEDVLLLKQVIIEGINKS